MEQSFETVGQTDRKLISLRDDNIFVIIPHLWRQDEIGPEAQQIGVHGHAADEDGAHGDLVPGGEGRAVHLAPGVAPALQLIPQQHLPLPFPFPFPSPLAVPFRSRRRGTRGRGGDGADSCPSHRHLIHKMGNLTYHQSRRTGTRTLTCLYGPSEKAGMDRSGRLEGISRIYFILPPLGPESVCPGPWTPSPQQRR